VSFSCTADEFARIVDGARRVEAQALSSEQQMETLLATTEADVDIALTALTGSSARLPPSDPFARALQAQLHRSQEGVLAARRLCVEARQNRLAANRLVSSLGDGRDDGPPVAERGMRHAVLVVDDYEDSRELIAILLHDAGFLVRTASNGLEALIAAYEMKPAVIVMDVSMPVLDGIEATRLIKKIDAIRDARVIAYTAKSALSQFLIDKLFAAVLEKPAPGDVVVATVRQYAAA
jgi:two-component system cell cycle response regulator DivK